MLVEGLAFVPLAGSIPGHPVPRELGSRHDRQALVVRLVQGPRVVEQAVHVRAPVVGDASEKDQFVVAARDVDRVELDRAEPIEDGQDPVVARRQGPRRREEVVERQVPAGHVLGDLEGARPPGASGRIDCDGHASKGRSGTGHPPSGFAPVAR